MKQRESWEKKAKVFDIFNVSDTIPGTYSSFYHFILPPCLVGSDFFHSILQMRKLMMDSLPSATQLACKMEVRI